MRIFPKGLKVESTKEYRKIFGEEWTGEVLSPTNKQEIVTVITSGLSVEHINEKWLKPLGVN